MTSFSRDQPGPGPRFRPGPGQLGEHAALNAGKSSGSSAAPSRKRRQGQGQNQQQGSSLGLPQRQEAPPDQTHLIYGLRFNNAQGLGRDLPFGLWALHNGYFSALAQGMAPVDWTDA